MLVCRARRLLYGGTFFFLVVKHILEVFYLFWNSTVNMAPKSEDPDWIPLTPEAKAPPNRRTTTRRSGNESFDFHSVVI